MTGLVSLSDAKTHLNIPASDTSHDAEIQGFIDGVQPVVEDITGPVVSTAYTEAHDGGTPYVLLRHRPVLSVTSVTEYRGTAAFVLTQVATPAAGTSYSYTFDTWGRIVRRGPGAVMSFPNQPGSVTVVYTAGLSAVPANIRLGALELIRHNYQVTQQGGRPGFGGGEDDIITPTGFAVPRRVHEFLAPNKRPPSIA